MWFISIALFLLTILLLITILEKLKHDHQISQYKEKGVHYLGHYLPNFIKEQFVLNKRLSSPRRILNRYSTVSENSPVGLGLSIEPGGQFHFFVTNLEIIRRILVPDFTSFYDRFHSCDSPCDSISFRMTSNAQGPTWKTARSLISQLFTSSVLKQNLKTLNKSGVNLTDFLLSQPFSSGLTVNVQSLASKFTIDVIATSGFDLNFASYDSPELQEFETMVRSLQTGDTFLGSCQQLFMQASPCLAGRLGFSMFSPEVLAYFQKLLVKVSTKEREVGESENSSFIAMVAEQANRIRDSRDRNLFTEVRDLDIVAQCLEYILAGYDTVMTVIQFAYWELCKHSEIQDKIYGEINQFGFDSLDALNSMEHLDGFVKEVLRFYPPGMLLSRICTKDYKVLKTEIVIPCGSMISLPILGVHRDNKYFEDAQVFNPRRFANVKATFFNKAYFPFGRGPRNCIGLHLGTAEVKVGIIHVLKHFKILAPPGLKYGDIEVASTTKTQVLRPRHSFDIVLQKRTDDG